MNDMNRKIKQYVLDLDIHPNEQKVQKAIQDSKSAFICHENDQILRYSEFLYQQGRYIHKRWWLIQSGVLLLLWFVLQYSESNYNVQRSMGIVASIFGLLIVPEIWKNRVNASMEIETASYFSLRQIYSARILLFAVTDVGMLSLFYFGTAMTTSLTLFRFLVDFMLPFTISCCICFRTLCSKHIISEYAAMFLCMAWDAVWLILVLNESFYEKVSSEIWLGVLMISVCYLIYCIKRLQKTCDKVWEVNNFGIKYFRTN